MLRSQSGAAKDREMLTPTRGAAKDQEQLFALAFYKFGGNSSMRFYNFVLIGSEILTPRTWLQS